MAACYFMGAREGIGKKSGRWYGMISYLTKDNFGNWAVVDGFCASKEVFDNAVKECDIGFPVLISCAPPPNSQIMSVVAHDSFPPLELCND